MRRICFRLRPLMLATIWLLPSATALAQAPSSIQLFMPNGGIPSRAIPMTLVRDDGVRDIVYTDTNGKFRIATPKTQTYNYTITIEGDRQTFATTVARFRLDRGIPNETNIFLNPIKSEKRPANGVLDAADLEANVPPSARAAYKRATDLISNGRFEDAIGDLQQAISLYPQYGRALNDLGVVFMKLNRLNEAATSFRQAIEIDKRFFHPRMNLGMVLNKQGKYREAVEVLEPLYGENRGVLELRLAYGQALGGAGKFSEAEKIYRATLETKNIPTATRANLYFRLGVVLNREGRFTDAASELERALALDPDAANSHVQLGAALMQLQQADRAERELLRAYELAGTKVGIAQLLLGQIYYAEKQFGAAQRAFEQYLTDVPSAPNAPQISKLIAELKTTPKN